MDSTTVTSADGTRLDARVSGSGPPLVLVHGSTGSKESWALVEPLLAERHTTWSYDRRGRGASGDGPQYSLACEVDDIFAVMAAAGSQVHLVAHSYGGVCALEAAARSDDEMASLVLYEPATHVDRRADVLTKGAALFDQGSLEEGLRVQLVEGAGISPEEFALIRSIPQVWDRFLDAAPTASREVLAGQALRWDPAHYRSITAPTLLLTGELTDSPVYLSADGLAEALPHAESYVLPGQRHIAFATDPAGFAAAVLAFTRR